MLFTKITFSGKEGTLITLCFERKILVEVMIAMCGMFSVFTFIFSVKRADDLCVHMYAHGYVCRYICLEIKRLVTNCIKNYQPPTLKIMHTYTYVPRMCDQDRHGTT
jgi:hypothetical protein